MSRRASCPASRAVAGRPSRIVPLAASSRLKRAEAVRAELKAVRALMKVTTELKAVLAGKSGDDGRANVMTPN